MMFNGPSRLARANHFQTATIVASVVTVITLAGCGSEPTEASRHTAPAPAETPRATAARQSAAAIGTLSVYDPKAIILPVSGAIYLSIENHGETDDHLVGASSPAASVVEMHESFEQDGVMRMQAFPEGFALPAGQALSLAPGGKHLMLVAPREAEAATASESGAGARPQIELTLQFAQAGDLVLKVPVVDPTALLASEAVPASEDGSS